MIFHIYNTPINHITLFLTNAITELYVTLPI